MVYVIIYIWVKCNIDLFLELISFFFRYSLNINIYIYEVVYEFKKLIIFKIFVN